MYFGLIIKTVHQFYLQIDIYLLERFMLNYPNIQQNFGHKQHITTAPANTKKLSLTITIEQKNL